MRNVILILILVIIISPNLMSQNKIEGKIIIDTIWKPVVYLSMITDFEDMNLMSNEMIVEKANIDSSGKFVFNTDFLPEGDNLYRIHIARKNDPPASLIIGGKDENHFYLIINKHFTLQIQDTSRSNFIKDALVKGYAPDIMVHQIEGIASLLDSTLGNGSYIKAELIRNAIYSKLRFIADTCTNPLVSLFALYKSNFEKDYPINKQFYNDYLIKWEKEHSSYFEEFRKKIPASGLSRTLFFVLSCIISLFIGITTTVVYLKLFKKERNLIHDLSIQERKIFSLILEGKSNKEISELLNIGLSTVKSHISSIYSKLDINSRKEILNLNINQAPTNKLS